MGYQSNRSITGETWDWEGEKIGGGQTKKSCWGIHVSIYY